MEPSIRYAAAANGGRIAYYTEGRAAPLVFAAGGPVTVISHELRLPAWRGWSARLATRRMLVRYDLRGTGLSDQDAPDFGLEAQVRDLAAVVDDLGLARFAILAAQHAGPAAIAYAARYPERVSHLLLWCTYACGSDYFGSTHSLAVHSVMAHDWALFTETVAHARLGWSEGALARQLAALLREHSDPASLAAFDRAAIATDVTTLLPLVHAPTLVLHRRQLAHPDPRIARTLAAGIPGARLVLLDGKSVAPFLGDTAAVDRAIEQFLNEDAPVPPRPGSSAMPGLPPAEPLSDRERAVLRLLAAGLSNREIATELFVTVGTAKTHLNSIYRKLDVHSRTRAVALARALGIINAQGPP